MRFILTTLIAIFLAFTVSAQSPIFEFECFSNANMTGDSCDICVGTSFQSRSFNGLMVYRLGVFNRWIDEPYLIRLRPGNSVEFIEQTGTNPDRITIPLNQTGFSTINGFIDSTFCAGANVDFSFFASDSLRTTAINYLDTIKIVGRGGTTVFFDTLTQKYIITSPASSGGTNLSFTGSSSPVKLNSSTGTDVNFVAGTSISLAATGTDLTITNTAPNINQTISYSAPTVTLSNGGGSFNIPQGTVTSVSVTPTQGVTASVATSTTTPNISIGLGNITPTTVVASGNISGANLSGTNTGNQTISYSAPNLSLSGGGGSVAIPQGDITGSGAGIQLAYFTAAKVIASNNRLTYDPSLYKLTLSQDPSSTITPDFSIWNGNSGSVATPALSRISGYAQSGTYLSGSIDFVSRAANLAQGAISFKVTSDVFSAGTLTERMFLDGLNGNLGIGTNSPARLLHVAGAARITGSAGTGTSVMLRDASGDISNAALGAGLSLSGGTLSSTATGTVGGTGTAGKVAYWSGTNTLTSTANFAFDGANLAVGTPTAGAGRFRVVGNSTSVSLQVNAGTLPAFGSTVQATAAAASGESIYGLDMTGSTIGVTTTNYLHKLENSGTGSTILQVNTAADGGDPAIQYNLVGATTKWIHGIDNSSEGNSFKLQPFAQLGDGGTGLTITTDGKFGINNQSPLASIDMDLTTDGIALSSGNTTNRPISGLRWLRYNSSMSGLETRTSSSTWHVLNSSQSVLLSAGSALGSSPTITVNNGTEMAYTVSLFVGTAPTANATIYTRTLANTWSVAPTVVFSAANQITASEITKFYVDTQTTGSYTIRANGTLTAGQTYKLNVIIRN